MNYGWWTDIVPLALCENWLANPELGAVLYTSLVIILHEFSGQRAGIVYSCLYWLILKFKSSHWSSPKIMACFRYREVKSCYRSTRLLLQQPWVTLTGYLWLDWLIMHNISTCNSGFVYSLNLASVIFRVCCLQSFQFAIWFPFHAFNSWRSAYFQLSERVTGDNGAPIVILIML